MKRWNAGFVLGRDEKEKVMETKKYIIRCGVKRKELIRRIEDLQSCLRSPFSMFRSACSVFRMKEV